MATVPFSPPIGTVVWVPVVYEQVAALSKVGQERRNRRKAARLARQRKRNSGSTPETDPHRGSSSGSSRSGSVVVDATEAEAGGADAVEEGARDGGGGAAEKGANGVRGEEVPGGVGVGGGGEEGEGQTGGGVSPPGGRGNRAGSDQRPDENPSESTAAAGVEHGEEGEEVEGERWYLMAGTWLSRWHSYVLSGKGEDLDFPTPPPGPITNGDLVDEESVPIPGKIAGKHYR